MIFVNHTNACASNPVAGKLTGKCNCKSAPLTVRAHKKLDALLAQLGADSLKAEEPPIYFAIRLEQLGEVVARRARVTRREAKALTRANKSSKARR